MLKELFNLFFKRTKKVETKPYTPRSNTVFFDTKEDYLNFTAIFKTRAKEKTLKSAHYFLLRNILLNREFDYGFSPISNFTKKCNGLKPYGALTGAYSHLQTALKGNTDFFRLSEYTHNRLLEVLDLDTTKKYFRDLYYADYQL